MTWSSGVLCVVFVFVDFRWFWLMFLWTKNPIMFFVQGNFFFFAVNIKSRRTAISFQALSTGHETFSFASTRGQASIVSEERLLWRKPLCCCAVLLAEPRLWSQALQERKTNRRTDRCENYKATLAKASRLTCRQRPSFTLLRHCDICVVCRVWGKSKGFCWAENVIYFHSTHVEQISHAQPACGPSVVSAPCLRSPDSSLKP